MKNAKPKTITLLLALFLLPAIAQASQISCTATTGSTCSSGTAVLRLYETQNSHAAVYNQSSLKGNHTLCCTGISLIFPVDNSGGTDCDSPGYDSLGYRTKMLTLYESENAHVASTGYKWSVCGQSNEPAQSGYPAKYLNCGVVERSQCPDDAASDKWRVLSVYNNNGQATNTQVGAHVAQASVDTGWVLCCSNTQAITGTPPVTCGPSNCAAPNTCVGNVCTAPQGATNYDVACSGSGKCTVDCSRQYCDSLQVVQTLARVVEHEIRNGGGESTDPESFGWTRNADGSYELNIEGLKLFTYADAFDSDTVNAIREYVANYNEPQVNPARTRILSDYWKNTTAQDGVLGGPSCSNTQGRCLALPLTQQECGRYSFDITIKKLFNQSTSSAYFQAVVAKASAHTPETTSDCGTYSYLHLPLDAPLVNEWLKADKIITSEPGAGVKLSPSNATAAHEAFTSRALVQTLDAQTPGGNGKYNDLTFANLANPAKRSKGKAVSVTIDASGYTVTLNAQGKVLVMPYNDPSVLRIGQYTELRIPASSAMGLPTAAANSQYSWMNAFQVSLSNDTAALSGDFSVHEFNEAQLDMPTNAASNQTLLPNCYQMNSTNPQITTHAYKFGYFGAVPQQCENTHLAQGAIIGGEFRAGESFGVSSGSLVSKLYENLDWCNTRQGSEVGDGCPWESGGTSTTALDLVYDGSTTSLSYNLAQCARTANCKY